MITPPPSETASDALTGKRPVMAPNDLTGQDLWGSYWATASVQGCTEQFPPSVSAAIARRWRAVFRTAADDSGLLDIACGRGAVLVHAREAGLFARGGRAVGIDRTLDVDIASPEFTFYGGIDAAHLPFADRTFALVTSQFGIEYAHFTAALSEAARVCGSRLIMLLHAADGVVCRHAAEQAVQTEWISKELVAVDRLRAHFSAPTVATAQDMQQVLAAIEDRARHDENIGMLEHFYTTMLELRRIAPSMPPETLLEMIDHVDGELGAHGARMRAMVRAALSAEDVAAASSRLQEAGFAVTLGDQRTDEPSLVGRWIDAVRT